MITKKQQLKKNAELSARLDEAEANLRNVYALMQNWADTNAKLSRRLENAEIIVQRLMQIHFKPYNPDMIFAWPPNYDLFGKSDPAGLYGQYEVKARTTRAGAVTLDELAQLVIDGTPLKRKKTEETEITAACGKIKQEEENGNN